MSVAGGLWAVRGAWCGCGAVVVRVLSKVDNQRLGAGLGAVLGVKQGCGSIQAKIRWLGVWCGGC